MASPFFTASASVGGFAEPDADLARLERAARAARARNTIIRANKERWALQTRETIDATDWYQPYIEILGRFSGDSLQRFGGLGWSAYQAGSLAPLIRTEQDLNILRIPSQIAAWTNPYYQAMRRVVVNYAGGDGWTYAADVEEDAGYPGMKEAYQGLIDEHLEYNGWGANGVGEAEQLGIEGEAIDRWVVHGEFVMRENRKSDGCTDLRILHPGQMTRPITGDPLAWSYGVHTDKFDAQKPIEYNLRYGPTPGDDDEIVDAGDLLHIKNNVWRDCKRGVPDGVFGTLDALRLAHILRGNLGDTAAQQAAVPWVEERPSGTVSEWGANNSAEDSVTDTDPYTGAARGYAFNSRGQIKQVPKGFIYKDGPGASSGSDKQMMVLSMLIRAGINKYHIPDWLVTGDPSVANYATSLTVDSGFVKSMRGVQKQFRGPFRTSVQRAVEWKLRCMGRLPVRFTDPDTGRVVQGAYDWRDVLRVCKVKVTCTDPVSHDPLQFAQEQEIELRNGVTSRQEWAAKTGTDINKVMRDNEEYNARFPETGNPLSIPPGFGDPTGAQP